MEHVGEEVNGIELVIAMIKLVDLIKLSGVDLGNFKIHCACNDQRSNWRPLQQYFDGSFDKGQASQSKTNFDCDNVLTLINLDNGRKWLFAGVYSVGGYKYNRKDDRYYYRLTRNKRIGHLAGRVIVDFNKNFRASYLRGLNHSDYMIVSSIREESHSIVDFPGFNKIRLSFPMLASIVRQNNLSWRSAIGNVAGIYLITDTETGKHYVGSAYGGVGLWQRWAVYVKTLHGGNRELRTLLRRKGDRYVEKLQFSLLEVCNIGSSQEYTVSRETHWKEILLTRQFGLNRN